MKTYKLVYWNHILNLTGNHVFKASIFHEEVPLEISSDQHDIVRNLKTLVMLNCEAFGVL